MQIEQLITDVLINKVQISSELFVFYLNGTQWSVVTKL
jgi:hypothetical protein